MKTLAKWTVLALVASAAGAFAQTTTAPATPPATSGATSQNFPVGAAPKVQVGQTYTADKKGDWEILCVKAASGPEPCEIGQLVLDDKGNPISDVRVFPLQPGSQAIAGATVVVPLGVLLANGLVIGIDGKKPKQYPYTFCNNVGCIARVGFTAIELQGLRKGTKGNLTFVMANNAKNPIAVPLSLKGFSSAYAALNKLLIEAQKKLKK